MQVFTTALAALKNLGGTASATIDLGRARPFMAWCSVTMVDSLFDFDRDNAYAIDIYTIDGVETPWQVNGGDHWGEAGDVNNVYAGTVTGTGRYVTCFLRSIHSDDLDTFGYCVVIALD